MNLRKEIESLAIWFVLASALVVIVNIIFMSFGSPNLEIVSEPLTFALLLKFFASFNVFGGLIDNIAVGAWLFSRSKICGYNKWLWASFGLAGSLVGGALFIFILAYESSQPKRAGAQERVPEQH